MEANGAPLPGSPHSRRASIAVILSIFQTGLGHVYAGRPRRGAVWLVAMVIVGALLFTAMLRFYLSLLIVPPILMLWLLMVTDAARVAAKAPAAYQLRPYNRWYVYVGIAALMYVMTEAARAVVRARVEAFRIPSGAMEPTILIGDFVFVAKDAGHRRDPQRGSIIVFRMPGEPKANSIKRIVALAGDTIGMSANVLYRNGNSVTEPYIRIDPVATDATAPEMRAWQLKHVVVRNDAPYSPSARNWGPLLVPPGAVFVLGDNRDNSFDSRYWGFVPLDHVVGRPMHVYYSYDRDSPWPLPFLTGIRWKRLGLRF